MPQKIFHLFKKKGILEIQVFLENRKETLEKKLEQKILKIIMSIRKIDKFMESRAKTETGHFLEFYVQLNYQSSVKVE